MNKDIVAASVLVLLAAAIGAMVLIQRHAGPAPVVVTPPPLPPPPTSLHPAALPATIPATLPIRRIAAAESSPLAPRGRNRANQSGPRGGQQAAPTAIDEPTARTALSQIGSDPQADAVWIAAINDQRLTPGQRRNLIEDLNETGFADPRNLTANDLPIIEYRMALIEQIAGDAIDDTNAAAFDEAYRDLVNMRTRLATQ